jgi:hypothetical protein
MSEVPVAVVPSEATPGVVIPARRLLRVAGLRLRVARFRLRVARFRVAVDRVRVAGVEVAAKAAEGFPFRQQFTELGVQLLHADLRHIAPHSLSVWSGAAFLRPPGIAHN